MKFETFQLERQQSIWENKVDYNLSESGVHPGTLESLFTYEFIETIKLSNKQETQLVSCNSAQNLFVNGCSSEAVAISMEKQKKGILKGKELILKQTLGFLTKEVGLLLMEMLKLKHQKAK